MRMITGLLFVGAAFMTLSLSIIYTASPEKISHWWIVASMGLQALGEICVIPLGLSTIYKLSPSKFRSLIMGLWLITIAYGHYLGGLIAQLSLTMKSETLGITDPQFFLYLGCASFIGGLLIWLAGRFLERSSTYEEYTEVT